jgi:hypothetical protein
MKNGLVLLKLDRPRFLRFGHKALKTLVALTGKSLDELDFEKFDLDNLEVILYCALLSDAKTNNETLKLEDMEDLLDHADKYSDVLEAMKQAMNQAFQSGNEEKN